MRPMKLGGVALVATVLALASPAESAYWFCNGNGHVINVGGAAYVTLDQLLDPNVPMFSARLYVETNGEQDLQRGGADLVFGDEDLCQDSPNPDLLVY